MTIQKLIADGFNKVSCSHILLRQGNTEKSVDDVKKTASRVSAWITKEKIPASTPVALILSDRTELISCILGILDASCVFVPLENSFPETAVKNMLKKADIHYAITDTDGLKYASVFSELNIQNVPFEAVTEGADNQESGVVFTGAYTEESPVYIYFTSGTTGEPKAILGKNAGLAHFIQWEMKKINTPGVKVSQLTSPSHDPFLRDVFLAICLGGSVEIPETSSILLDGKKLYQWIQDSGVNIVHCTPSLLRHMLSDGDGKIEYPELRYVFLAGEKVSVPLVKKWYEKTVCPAQLVNLYGPTETTMAKVFYDIQPDDVNSSVIPLGKPISDTEVIIFNDDMVPCAAGEPGSIYIGTEYRTFGYVHNDALNSSSFIENPIKESSHRIIYKTGDNGYFQDDGTIIFTGRSDNQVKIRGNRVELNAVETAILQIDGVNECAVVFSENEQDKEFITAYVVTEKEISKNQIIEYMKERYPVYMIPTYIVFLERLPLNKNMKVDRSALPDPRKADHDTSVSPLSDIQQRVVSVFRSVLGIQNISLEDNFFALGGTSLEIMTLIARIYEEFAVEITMEDVFESDSIEVFASVIEEKTEENSDFDSSFQNMYTLAEYEQKLKSGYVYSVKPSVRVLDNVKPFNDIFYRSCIMNAIFPIVTMWNLNLLPLLKKDIFLYGKVRDFNESHRAEYIELESLPESLHSLGIEMRQQEIMGSVIQPVIDSINAGCPVVLGIDCFFERNRPEFYLQSNWPHSILVYGYDGVKQEFLIIEHTGVNNLDYQKQTLPFLDLEYAFQSGKDKYPSMENGWHYLEFKKSTEPVACSENEEFQSYRTKIASYRDTVRNDIEGLADLLSLLRNSTENEENWQKNRQKINVYVESIVEAKEAQVYMFSKMADSTGAILDLSFTLEKITEKWKFLRNVVYRACLSNRYNHDSFEKAFVLLSDVQKYENDLLEKVYFQGNN